MAVTIQISSDGGEPREAGRSLALPPRFRVDTWPDRGVVHVRPVGEVDLATVDVVRTSIEELKAAGFKRVVLDLREVTFLDSTGLRLMLEAQASSRADGWEFAVIDGSPAVQRLFDVSGMRSVICFLDPARTQDRTWC
jgi:anti-anti-sigma factor